MEDQEAFDAMMGSHTRGSVKLDMMMIEHAINGPKIVDQSDSDLIAEVQNTTKFNANLQVVLLARVLQGLLRLESKLDGAE